MSNLYYYGKKGGVTPIIRPALPPFPPITSERGDQKVWSAGPYGTIVTADIKNPKFYMGNFCGLRGYPNVPDGSPHAFMSMFVDRLDASEQDRYLRNHLQFGYNVVQTSLWHSRYQWNQSLDQFIATQKKIQSYGLETDVFLTANDVHWGGLDYYKPELETWVKELIAAGALNRATLGWQLDKSWSPRGIYEVSKWLSSLFKPANIDFAGHWMNHALAWWDDESWPFDQTIASAGVPDIVNRFAWHDLHRQYFKYHHMQLDVWDTIGSEPGPRGNPGTQWSIKLALETTPVVYWEYAGQNSFDGEQPEDFADLMGFLGLCGPTDDYPLVGLGNGGRMPNGHAIRFAA